MKKIQKIIIVKEDYFRIVVRQETMKEKNYYFT